MRTGVILHIHVTGWKRIFTITGEKLCLYPRFNVADSFFATPTCHTDKAKLEQRCIYHSAPALWDLVRGRGAEGNLEAARSLSANTQHSPPWLQRLLEGRPPQPDTLLIRRKPRPTRRQRGITRIYSCFTVGIHDNRPIIQANTWHNKLPIRPS